MKRKFVFGIRTGELSVEQQRQRDDVAARNGCDWFYVVEEDGWRSWFVGPDKGEPANTRLELTVLGELARRGVIP